MASSLSSYKISTVAQTKVEGNMQASLNLNPTVLTQATLGNAVYDCYPTVLASRIPVESTETWELANYYQSPDQILKLLIVKASRPVQVKLDGVISGDAVEYVLPYNTYIHQVFDSRELTFGFRLLELHVTCAAASLQNPMPLPPNYPDAQVEVLLAVQKTIVS
jgi:hypothetical protein